jgi:methylated-DNA-protein-cysteine methyltransferase-like protein
MLSRNLGTPERMARPTPATPADEARARILAAVRALPRGRVAAYGQVAERAGLPGRARLVGRVLAQSTPAMKLPWHRVMRAGGRLAFPEGSTLYAEQVRRLRAEGVEVRAGRVAAVHFVGAPDLDAALWAPR